ncbi:MAG TPA: glycosyltransferase family 9 protein [Thermoanaerobaculia bacterium]|nr:glycosyltransferase family 9 protein [Thermoanaerobaculia bacterium]
MRVLLIRLSSFGDVVFTLPAARALKRAGSGVEVAWAIEAPLAPLVAGAPYVDRVLTATTRSWRRSPLSSATRAELRAFLAEARAFAPDVVLDAQGLLKSAWATLLVPARRKIGFGLASAKERLSCLALDERVETRARHVADRGLALVAHLTGRPRAERTPDVAHLLAAAPEPEVALWLADRGTRPFALLQPFSSSPPKEWRAEHVLDFARRAAGDGLDAVVRFGPGERRRAETLVSASEGALTLAPSTGPASTALLASRAAVFVGADTGPTHLAAAAATPTVALFGPTDPARFGPIGPRALVWPLPGYNSHADQAGREARDVFVAARSLLRS